MSGQAGTDDDVIRHQQEKDLGHEVKPDGAERARPDRKGSGGEETGRESALEQDNARRRKPSQ